jgi:hypothetical protein
VDMFVAGSAILKAPRTQVCMYVLYACMRACMQLYTCVQVCSLGCSFAAPLPLWIRGFSRPRVLSRSSWAGDVCRSRE